MAANTPKDLTKQYELEVEHLRASLFTDAKRLHTLMQRTRDSEPVRVEMFEGFEHGTVEVPCEFVLLAQLVMIYERNFR